MRERQSAIGDCSRSIRLRRYSWQTEFCALKTPLAGLKRAHPMQNHCSQLTEKLLKSLDGEYNVINAGCVLDVLTALEKVPITKEVLENTRLGKHINEFRRKTKNDILAKKAKDLLKRWRDMVAAQAPQVDAAPPTRNGANPQSPALRGLKPQSPALRGLKPQSPLVKAVPASKISNQLTLAHSENSRSPLVFPNKSAIISTSNHRLKPNEPVLELSTKVQNHTSEAVPRTHSSNKRLRINDSQDIQDVQEQTPQPKKPRRNGEVVNDNSNGSSSSFGCVIDLNSQVPSPIPVIDVDQPAQPVAESAPEPEVIILEPKKRGRKKGSKSLKRQSLLDESVKEKLASVSRNPKVKTTKELLADLQARGCNALPSQGASTPNVEDVLRRGGEVLQRLKPLANSTSSSRPKGNQVEPLANCDSQVGDASWDVKDTEASDFRESHSKPLQQALTVEDILAKLPPLEPDSIVWDEDEVEVERVAKPVDDEDVERLHRECIEGLNGNFEPRLAAPASSPSAAKENEETSSTSDPSSLYRYPHGRVNEVFREWHQIVSRPSCDDEILHIMPYVIVE